MKGTMQGILLGGRAWPGRVLTALAKVEDKVPLHVGAAHQVLCGLNRVDGLCPNLALFGAQTLALTAEDAGGTSGPFKPWTDETARSFGPPQGYPPHLLPLRVKPGGH